MSHEKNRIALLGCIAFCLTLVASAQPGASDQKSVSDRSAEFYSISTKSIKSTISPTLWGLFFEDINRGADGGLYAEMVKNRSFDFPDPMTGWKTWPGQTRDGVLVVTNQIASNPNNPKYMAVSLMPGDTVGLVNEGFGGMALKKGAAYNITLRYRILSGNMHSRAFLFNGANHPIAKFDMPTLPKGNNWQETTVSISPTDSTGKGKLLIIFEGAGRIDVDRISLFPSDTWKARSGGLRTDLVQAMADLHPGFLRFPGGCIVEGRSLASRYQWKKTIGPLEDRQLIKSIWNDDVPDRQTPDYFQSFGLGFLEYFELCEDIGASPLPIVNCGMSCQFDAAEVAPLDELNPYIQDALDLVEFANGDINTTWGAKRADLGHPAPFHMQMIGVGNENWGPQYAERLSIFTKAIKDKYPEIKIVNATGYSPRKTQFLYMDSVLRSRNADIIDEHFYNSPEWFMQHATRYDNYDRKGPKIFVGEYAAQSDRIGSLKNENNLKTALAEAAFMTGLERNSDVISMASYAPLFAHVDGWQWTPNLIWFDNARSFKTPNYYVQQLFSLNKGTYTVGISQAGNIVAGQDSCWASSAIDQKSNELIVKIINMSESVKERTLQLDTRPAKTATITTLSDPDLKAVNSLDKPQTVAPVTTQIATSGKKITLALKPYSFNVLRVRLN